MAEAVQALGINPGYLIGYSLNVIAMIAILGAVAWKPITEMLNERRERIAEGVNNARKAEEALASAEADKQAILDDARAEAQRLISEARTRAEESASSIRTRAEEEATRTRQNAQAEAAKIQEEALGDMRGQIVDIAIAAANHLVGGLDEDRQREMVNTFFTDIPDEATTFPGEVTVITAVPLTDDEKATARERLAEADEVVFRVDPSIRGGVVVRAGAREVDNSYSAQLAAMRSTIS